MKYGERSTGACAVTQKVLSWPGNLTLLPFTISRHEAIPTERNASELQGLCNRNNVTIAGVLHKIKDERFMRSCLSVPSVTGFMNWVGKH
jgi:hypothetical protein